MYRKFFLISVFISVLSYYVFFFLYLLTLDFPDLDCLVPHLKIFTDFFFLLDRYNKQKSISSSNVLVKCPTLFSIDFFVHGLIIVIENTYKQRNQYRPLGNPITVERKHSLHQPFADSYFKRIVVHYD